MPRRLFLQFMLLVVPLSAILAASRPAAAGEGVEQGKTPMLRGRLRPVDADPAERKRCAANIGKLAALFADYANQILQVAGSELIEGALPPNAEMMNKPKWPDPLQACNSIRAIFAGNPGVRGFSMKEYSYEGLCRLNQLINADLEKGGFHAYLSDDGKKRLTLICVAGDLLELRRDKPLQIWGKTVKADPRVIGKFLVRYPYDVYANGPSFVSDRKIVYHLTEIHRLMARQTWDRLESLRSNGVDFAADRVDDDLAARILDSLEGTISRLTYAAWRDVYVECRRDRTEEEACNVFCDVVVESTVEDFDVYEEVQLLETKGKIHENKVKVKAVCALTQIAHAQRPMDCILAKARWLALDAGSDYRKAAELFLPLLVDEVVRMTRKTDGSGGGADDRPLFRRLTETCGISPEDLRLCAEAAFKKLPKR